MKNWIKVARFHLFSEGLVYWVGPWLPVALSFLVIWVIFSQVPAAPLTTRWVPDPVYSYNLLVGPHGLSPTTLRVDPAPVIMAILVFAFSGLLTIIRALPYALSLGVSRRDYYIGTALLAAGVGAINGFLLAILQVVEEATKGWGIGLHAFWMFWILKGPWYTTWWTTSVILGLGFIYGMWWGLVYWRWRLLGVLTFLAIQTVLLLAVVLVVSKSHVWHSVWHFFAGLGAAGLTDVLAGMALILFVCGAATIRRATV